MMSESSGKTVTLVRYGLWGHQLLLGAAAVGMAVLLWRDAGGISAFWPALALLGVLALIGMLPSETCIDTSQRTIERRYKLLGLFTVYRRLFPLAQFRGVCCHYSAAVESGDWHTWRVGLINLEGKPVYLTYFKSLQADDDGAARRFGAELSDLTGLPFEAAA
jgi:hypothetical protein